MPLKGKCGIALNSKWQNPNAKAQMPKEAQSQNDKA
jgi:hypothetical protein